MRWRPSSSASACQPTSSTENRISSPADKSSASPLPAPSPANPISSSPTNRYPHSMCPCRLPSSIYCRNFRSSTRNHLDSDFARPRPCPSHGRLDRRDVPRPHRRTGPGRSRFRRPLSPLYRSATRSAPDPDPESGPPAVVLSGAMPSPSAEITGCPFASRCNRKISRSLRHDPAAPAHLPRRPRHRMPLGTIELLGRVDARAALGSAEKPFMHTQYTHTECADRNAST